MQPCTKNAQKEAYRYFLKGSTASPLLNCFIEGVEDTGGHKIINSIVTAKRKNLLYQWKIKIADEINGLKDISSAPKTAAISLSFFFYRPFHRNMDFDVENFIKPVIDGLTKGLFCTNWEQEKTQGNIRFNEDDSIFRKVYFERFDVDEPKEGVYITV